MYEIMYGKTINGEGKLNTWKRTSILKKAVEEAEELSRYWKEYELKENQKLQIEVIDKENSELRLLIIIDHKGSKGSYRN